MSAKVLVLGGTGMLGHMVLRVLSADSKLSVWATHLTKLAELFFLMLKRAWGSSN